ncbi:MAG: Fic/DOC family N-terminal domain-containing protein [Bacteroidales bacterium]
MNKNYQLPLLPLPYDLETKLILKQLNQANKKLAELKGVARTIPNENILISTLTLQEAKDSSEVENIITTQDDLYKADLGIKENLINASTKEVLSYREAIQEGFALVRQNKLLTNNIIKQIQAKLEHNKAGFRSVPGTALKRNNGEIVYTPPQDNKTIETFMSNLEQYINNERVCEYDPLIKMAIIHHQFESIHPFYDGNGRTGRIINILYLFVNDLLELPILYLSRYITHNKILYYQLIQAIRDKDGDNSKEWEEWILFMLKGVEETANETIRLVKGIGILMNKYKKILRPLFDKQYKHELLNNLFFHPYTKIEFMERDMMVQRKTAAKYLEMIVETGLLVKIKKGRENFYINQELMELFANHSDTETSLSNIESVIV